MTYWSCTDGPGEPLCTDDPCEWWAPRRRRCGSVAGRKNIYGIWLVAGGVGASPAEKTYGIWHMAGCWLLVAVCCHGTRVGMGMATKNIWHMAYMAVDVLETVNVTKRFVVTDVTLKRKRGKSA